MAAIGNVQNQRFPRCPNPRCVTCKRELDRISVYSSLLPTATLALVECLVECRCGERYLLQRRLHVTPMGMRFVGQVLTTYDPAQHDEGLKKVLAALQRQADPHAAPGDPSAVTPATEPEQEDGAKPGLFARLWPFGKKAAPVAKAA